MKRNELVYFKGAFDWPYSGIRINGIASRFFFGVKCRTISQQHFVGKRCCKSSLYSDHIKILVDRIFRRKSSYFSSRIRPIERTLNLVPRDFIWIQTDCNRFWNSLPWWFLYAAVWQIFQGSFFYWKPRETSPPNERQSRRPYTADTGCYLRLLTNTSLFQWQSESGLTKMATLGPDYMSRAGPVSRAGVSLPGSWHVC